MAMTVNWKKTNAYLEVSVYDGSLAMVESRDGLANITKYLEHFLLGETFVEPVVHHLEDCSFVIGHQKKDLMNPTIQQAHTRVDISDQVGMSIQIGLKNTNLFQSLYENNGD